MQDTPISKDVLHKLNQLGAMFHDVPYGLMVPSCGELGRQDGRQAESQASCLPVYPVCISMPLSPSCPVFVLGLDLLRLRLRERFRRREVLRARFSGLRSRLVVSSVSNSACIHCIPVFPTSENSLTAKVSASTGAGGGMLSSHNHFSKVNFDISNKVQQTRTWLSVHMVALTCSTASLDLLTTTIGPTSAASPFALQRNAIKIHLTTWTRER